MILYKKLPEYLLGKYQLIGTVTFSVLVAIIFLNIYIPFSDTAWFELGESGTFLTTIAYGMTIIVMLIASRMLMYKTKRFWTMNYLSYIIWCGVEILFTCLLYAWFTIEFIKHGNGDFMEIFRRSLISGVIALGVPYIIAGMYFAIIDKDKTIKLLNYEHVVTDEPPKPESQNTKITLFDNSGALKLSISPDNLYYIESDDNYIKVWYTDSKGEMKQYMLRCRLKTVEEDFRSSGLVRCNRKYIVNIKKVSMLRKENEGFILDLANENIPPLPVTKTYTDAILSYFTDQSPLLEPIDE